MMAWTRRRALLGGAAATAAAAIAGPVRARQDRLPVGGRMASLSSEGPAVIPHRADETLLRAYGAKLDGIADDRAALQAVVDDARRRTPAVLSLPSVAIELPPGCVLLSGPLRTGGCNVSIRGAGQNVSVLMMRAGATGILEHGTAEQPARGSLQLQDLSIVDGNPKGSGCTGVSIRFAADAPQSAMTWQGVALRKWTRPASITNCPRNWHCENVTVFGPDFAMQDAAGFEISSTADFSQGCFTYVFINVLVANYAWGWRYDIRSPLEGQRFYSCTCYNGWGMVQATVNGVRDAAINIDPTYHSVIWVFTDCDWQGLGYALDLVRCREVQVVGGFFIANKNAGNLPIPGGRPRRRYMSFVDCIGVTLDRVKFDVFAGSENTLSLVYADAACRDVQAFNTDILAYAPIYAAWEFADPNHPCPVDATMGEFDTRYNAWSGGTKVRDPGNNQIAQSLIRETGHGDVSTSGRWELFDVRRHLSTDAKGHIRVAFPTRPDGAAWFRAVPVVQFNTLNALVGVPAGSLFSVSRSEFVVAFSGTQGGLEVDISFRAIGS